MSFDIKKMTSIVSLLANYPAIPYQDKAQLPRNSGIYFVTLEDNQILYIGKTNNFFTRWLAHHKTEQLLSKYDPKKLIIIYCHFPSSSLDKIEVELIRLHKPPENNVLFETQTFQEWVDNGDISKIPKEVRQQIFISCHCTCSMCGSTVSSSRIPITKFKPEHSGFDNYTLICQPCLSSMRGAGSIEQFRINQRIILLRDTQRLKEQIHKYFQEQCEIFEDIEKFIHNNEIIFYYEKN
jgi:predicted GIY-YIG superfamily endonuclease